MKGDCENLSAQLEKATRKKENLCRPSVPITIRLNKTPFRKLGAPFQENYFAFVSILRNALLLNIGHVLGETDAKL